MAHVESFYLDANLEQDALPVRQTEQAEQLEKMTAAARQLVEEKVHVASDYCAESQPELENPNQVTMSSSILDNNKYFAPPRVDSSEYAWHTDVVTSHHQYAQSPNIYTNDYMTSEPSDYVYM